MKKSPAALLALGVLASAAHAQSSVTLYGIIDEGFDFTTNVNGAHQFALFSGAGLLQGSRWGLTGKEDLGGGLAAVFKLENGFDINTGASKQGGLLFGRQAFIGLSSRRFGMLTAGRQYDSVFDYVQPLTPVAQWGGFNASHPGDIDNFGNSYRVDNSIKYASPNFGGLTFGGMYGFGGEAGNFTGNQFWSLGAAYAYGPLRVGAAYENARTPSNVGGIIGNSTTSSTAAGLNPWLYNAAQTSGAGMMGATASNKYGYASANTYQIIGVAGQYSFGSATIGLNYSNVQFINIAALGGSTAKFNTGEINFRYRLNPALVLGAAYDYTVGSKLNGGNAARYSQGVLGADYFVSKRTDVYLLGIYQHASGDVMTASGPVSATAEINGTGPGSNNQNDAMVRLGIRHKF